MIPEVFFWICILLVAHTYVLYPLILIIFSAGRKSNAVRYDTGDDELPMVSIIVAAFNEEFCIQEKLESIYAGTYPTNKFEVLVGSDASSDRTVEVAESFAVSRWPLAGNPVMESGTNQPIKNNEKSTANGQRPTANGQRPTANEGEPMKTSLRVLDFKERRGKQSVVNDLVRESRGEILVLTDANVMFDKDTLYNMVRHFKNPRIGLVDTNMINRGMKESGISYQEKAYISREVKIKDRESRIWGAMMGPFGGCYAIRKEDFAPVPPNFLVDDFYLNMKIFEKGKLAINDIQSRVYEDLPEQLKVEFRRKVRIGTGDFQNLRAFWKLMFKRPYGFAFLSHKIIRWFGPFFLLAAFILNIFLALDSRFYQVLLAGQALFYLIPFLDFLLKRAGIHLSQFRLVTHFVSMNAALLLGFFRSLKTIRSGAWERTTR